MAFFVGSRVQAIDELGRWEEAKVVGILEDGFNVTFIGFGKDCDMVVTGESIRSLIDPFQIVVGEYD